MTIDSYSYNTLNSELHEIRLLTLESGSHDEALQCRLSTVALATRPTYNALSYVWGDPVVTITEPTIVLDGQRFVVTPNLYSALRHLRPPPGIVSICLWVDAVCINQGDLDERNEQVAMMRDIYASATQVTIWLGEADDDSDATFDALSMITGHKPWPQEKSQCSNIHRHCGNFFFFLDNRRSWLSRVWILQELAMARNDPVVVCGHKRASWSEFVTAWQTIAKETFAELGTCPKNAETTNGGSINERDDLEPLTQVKLDILDKLRQAVQSRGGDRLRQLLMISRTSAATDPRDRIYGLLGLLKEEDSNPESSIPIPIDYRKNCAEVYTDAMAHIFSRGEGPYFLSGIYLSGGPAVAPHVPFLPESIVQPGLPSWVPDFSRQESWKSAQPGGYLFHPPTTMHASGAGQGAKNGWILSDGQTLQVEGLIVDKIVEVTSFGTTFDVVKAKLVHLEDMTREARRRPCSFASSIAPLMQRFRDSEPLWRILISNKHLKSGYEPAPSSYEEMYTSLLKHHGTTKTHDLAHNTSSNSSPPSEYERSLYSCVLKSFLTTVNGFIGTCPPASCPSDVIAIIFGSPSPFVLRPIPADTDEKQKYWLIGPSYIGGIMNGEMVDELYCEDLMDSTTFFIR